MSFDFANQFGVSFGASQDPTAGLYLLPQDQTEAYAMAGTTSGDSTVPWWQNLAVYGITRAIDNQFGTPPVNGNIAPGSFGGQNGLTYQQTAVPSQVRAGLFSTADTSSGGMLGLVLLAGFAFLVMNAGAD